MPSGFWIGYFEKLAIVAAILGAIYAAARRLRHTRLFAHSGRLRVIESLVLSQHGALYVVSVAKRCFLIGAAPGSVSALAELEPVDFEVRR
jgi:flagellar biogenesis protein FliO